MSTRVPRAHPPVDKELLLLLFDLVDATYVEDDAEAVRAAGVLATGPVTLLEPLGPARALVVPTELGTVVAVRGSGAANPRELWLNAWINLVAVPVRPVDLGVKRGLVHGGYFGAAASLFDGLVEAIHDSPDDSMLYVTGFSLGGVVAQCLALAIQVAMPTAAVRPVTFASPKLGTRETARALTRLGLVRVELAGDLVPWLPPWPFRHGGTAVVPTAPRRTESGRRHDRSIYRQGISEPRAESREDRERLPEGASPHCPQRVGGRACTCMVH